MPKVYRKPLHAGSWYEDEAETLAEQIDGWLAAAPAREGAAVRAIIAPHAGYRYCGHVMAHAYKHIDPSTIRRVFLLGPSHHVYTRKCALSSAQQYRTPLGDMEIDQEVYAELKATGAFELMSCDVDEAEHSLELHTPYIVRVMGSHPFKLVPIMVGSITADSEASYGALLGRYLDDPTNLFVISSDFCHWGNRFSYTFYDSSKGAIWQSIQWLDEQALKAIETGDPKAFAAHLAQYKNTVCGRHPIAVLLNMLQHCSSSFSIATRFYDQSSRCLRSSDSSVSYASTTITPV